MIAVITADIINSTKNDAWRELIIPSLNQLGTTPLDWSIYRGDSIQIRITDPTIALHIAVVLKSAVRRLKEFDIRIAIGIGEESLKTDSVTQNSGSAYVNSGRLLEDLPQNLAIKTPWQSEDSGLNAGLDLFNTLCEQWTIGMANSIHTKLQNPSVSQEELALLLHTTQPNVSRILSRSNYRPLQKYLDYYQEFIKSKL